LTNIFRVIGLSHFIWATLYVYTYTHARARARVCVSKKFMLEIKIIFRRTVLKWIRMN